MEIVDDGGIYRLLAGIVTQARKDARRGDLQAYSFIEYMKRGNMDDLFGSMEQDSTPAALSADEIQERARRLTDLGISEAWALVASDPVRLAEHERLQRRRDLAARLGVDHRYLPEDFGND